MLGLTGCNYLAKPKVDNSLSIDKIATLLPPRNQDKTAWATDIHDIFNTLKIERNAPNLCSAIAIIDQESNFKADPPVANLGKTSLTELNAKLDEKLGNMLAGYFRNMLKNEPTPQNSFEKQILKVHTEQQLDKLYHQMFEYFSQKYYTNKITNLTKIVGGDIAEKLDPITTLGSMQVHIDYARNHQRLSGNNEELRRDLYSQYGGLYYGIHRLMLYQANYSDPIYRFADYNSGMYSSRNAGFQKMLAELTKQKIDLDGDLLNYNGNVQSQSEKALNGMAQQGLLALTARQIHSELSREKSQNFADTEIYHTISSLYKMKTGKEPIVAMMPQVVISGAKLSRDYDTNWYASAVNKRYLACMAKAR
ncbi:MULTISPECIES: DUF1615 family protein [unclassified Moraxella]|uniref:DUF1615 family protein n=1 Tax=unclassified Moraxella TaxID=2685852 RepID=UPI003AF57819